MTLRAETKEDRWVWYAGGGACRCPGVQATEDLHHYGLQKQMPLSSPFTCRVEALRASKGAWEGVTPVEAGALRRAGSDRVRSQDDSFLAQLEQARLHAFGGGGFLCGRKVERHGQQVLALGTGSRRERPSLGPPTAPCPPIAATGAHGGTARRP